MNTPDHIRDTLERYLRGELDTREAEVIAASLQADPSWQEVYRQLLLEKLGIRYYNIQSFKNILTDYESEIKIQEKNSGSAGYLSTDPSLNYTTNDLKGADVKTEAHEMKEDHTTDKKTIQGIRYTSLKGKLDIFKQEEVSIGGAVLPKKNEGKVVRLRKYWLAVAAGLLILIIAAWPWIRPQTYAEKLIASGFVVPEMTDLVRGPVEDSIQMIVQKAYGAYAEGDYKLALKYFESIPMQENERYYLYYGVALLMSGKMEKGNTILDSLNAKWNK